MSEMKRLIFGVVVCVAVLAAQAKTSTPAGWTDDYDAALKRAAAEKKLVLADFSGEIGRLCVGLGVKLHLIRPLGFRLDDRSGRSTHYVLVSETGTTK